MNIYLLDVNVLLALCDPGHLHHGAAHRWFEARGAAGWATCPLTENAFVRIAGQPAYPNSPGGPETAAGILREFCRSRSHHFWPDSISLLDRQLFKPGIPVGPQQITDIYLLGLAVKHGGRLATLDRRIPAEAVEHGPKALELLAV